MEFEPSQEQLTLRDLVRGYVQREVVPVAHLREKIWADEQRFPWDLVEKGSELGLRTLTVPADFGGPDIDVLTTCMLGEELAAGDLGVAVIFDQVWKICRYLSRAATDDLQRDFWPEFLRDPRHLLAIAYTEPDLGSDRYLIFNDPKSVMRTRAVSSGGGWLINGTKHFISNGSVAKTYVVFCNTDPGQPMARGTTTFLVQAGTPGFRIGQIHRKIGQKLVMNAELIFEDCWVPDAQRLGPVGEAFQLRARFAGESQVEAGATALGVGRAAYEAALGWASERVQGGRRVIEHQEIACMLADMATRIEAARTLLWRAAWAADRGDPQAARLGAMAKVLASETAFDVSRMAVEVHGGYGIMEDIGVEKYLRDAVTFLHSDGTNQVHRLRVAAWLDQSRPGDWAGAY